MASTIRTIIVFTMAAAAVVGAGVYFSPKKSVEGAAGTVAPAAANKAGGAPESPSATASGAPQQPVSPMDGKSQASNPNAAAASPAKDQGQGVGYGAVSDRRHGVGYGAASDRRLKSNIVRIGTHALGIGLYEYDIFGERQLGVMADEVEQVMPEAVTTHPTLGYKMVRYDLLNQPRTPGRQALE